MCDQHESKHEAGLSQLDALIKSIDEKSLTLSQLVDTYRVSMTEIIEQEKIGNDTLGVQMGVEMVHDGSAPTTMHLHTEVATKVDATEAEGLWELCMPFIKATLADEEKEPAPFDYHAFEKRLGCGFIPGDPLYPLLKQLKAVDALGHCACNIIEDNASDYVVSLLVNHHVVNVKVDLGVYTKWQMLQASKHTTH